MFKTVFAADIGSKCIKCVARGQVAAEETAIALAAGASLTVAAAGNAALLLASRKISQGITWVKEQAAAGADVAAGDQKGVAGSEYNGSTGSYPGFATKQYPDGITAAAFPSCTKNISDYTNQKEVQECRLSSMWDFNSESEKVQDIQSDYLASLWNAGVRGFRMDAVKHIHTDSMKAIKEKFAKKIGKNVNDIYWIQEVIGNASEAAGIQPSNYVQNGTVTEFGFKSEMNQTDNQVYLLLFQ